MWHLGWGPRCGAANSGAGARRCRGGRGVLQRAPGAGRLPAAARLAAGARLRGGADAARGLPPHGRRRWELTRIPEVQTVNHAHAIARHAAGAGAGRAANAARGLPPDGHRRWELIGMLRRLLLRSICAPHCGKHQGRPQAISSHKLAASYKQASKCQQPASRCWRRGGVRC